jgi:hypothetical protein
MMVAKFDDLLLARQLEETLLEAGFNRQEIFIDNWGESIDSRLQLRTQADVLLETIFLTVHTKTQLDEDLAKAVFRDLGVQGRRIKARAGFDSIPHRELG